MRSLIVIFALVTLATASADEACTPSTSAPELDTGETPFGRYYGDNDVCQFDGPSEDEDGDGYPDGGGACLFSIWFYQESNGIDGLQRGDEVVDDTCGGQIESDSLAFY